MPAPFPEFRARAPWWGGDLQTLRNFLRRPRPELPGAISERLVLKLADGSGDALAALHERPSQGARGPLAVLIHGLSGSEESSYMGCSAAQLVARGHGVVRLNLRGAGASRPLCRFQYHAGRTGDLRDALKALPRELVGNGLVLIGFSLGGNVLLKFLAEHAAELPIRASVSISAPLDLEAASLRFLERRNRVYHWRMLRAMKRESLAPGAELSACERDAIAQARTIWEFDDRFVAPRNGFRDASHYYATNMARRFLPQIRVPTLVIQALDDPWVPPHPATSFRWHENPSLVPLLAQRGGHVGSTLR